MALPYHALAALKPYLKGSCLSLGYPDLMVSPEQLKSLFGHTPTRFTNGNEWHKTEKPLPETGDLFYHLGMKLKVVDFARTFGVDVVADLNHPQDFGEHDLVIDPGTLEHCFNIGQAFINAVCSVKEGGAIMHLSPMNMLNHGFYNLNPTLFHDFYTQNKWDVKEIKVLPASDPNIHSINRFDLSQDFIIRTIAVRKPESTNRFPIQSKYLSKVK